MKNSYVLAVESDEKQKHSAIIQPMSQGGWELERDTRLSCRLHLEFYGKRKFKFIITSWKESKCINWGNDAAEHFTYIILFPATAKRQLDSKVYNRMF